VFITKNTEAWRAFPPSRRTLIEKLDRLPAFWPHIWHKQRIDLSHFNLPSGTKYVDFEFLDPLWGWLMAARRQDPADLHWKPCAQGAASPVYGGGLQFGQCFLHACKSCPQGTYPMACAFHWDGTHGRGLQSAPICIGLGNTNICNSQTQFCLGYMPHVPDEAVKTFRQTTKATTVKFYIRQRCAAAILNVLESAAAGGFWCRLKNIQGNEVERLLFPRLVSMNFDQPEAQLFFGMQNKTSCSKCKRRRGRSAFRHASPQQGAEVIRLYAIANDDDSAHKNTARNKLKRWGFNWNRRCCLRSSCDKLLVRIPGRDEVFPSVDWRDTLHGLMMFLHRVLMEGVDGLHVLTAKIKRLLNQRLRKVCHRRCFRAPDGKAYRTQKSIFSDVGMTAVDKTCMIFLLPHVLGPGADIIPDQRYRTPLLEAIAWAQLMIIAARGLRSYTEEELNIVYNRGYLRFFAAMEELRRLDYDARVLCHEQKQDDEPPPKRFKRQHRFGPHNSAKPHNSATVFMLTLLRCPCSHNSATVFMLTLLRCPCSLNSATVFMLTLLRCPCSLYSATVFMLTLLRCPCSLNSATVFMLTLLRCTCSLNSATVFMLTLLRCPCSLNSATVFMLTLLRCTCSLYSATVLMSILLR
jgi:hypothetical protein